MVFQNRNLILHLTVAKMPFALRSKCAWNIVKFTQVALYLILEVLYSVDVIMLFGKMCAVIDAVMAKLTGIKHIVAFVEVGIADTLHALGFYLFLNNWQ